MGGGDRLRRITGLLEANSTGGATLVGSLSRTAADVLDVSGAALMLMEGGHRHQTVSLTGTLMATVEDLQQTCGEGPCVEAYRLGRSVLEPDLAAARARRWVGFTPLALEAGARAVFGFPLQIGAARIGALNLCSDRSRPLSGDQLADALVLTDVATHVILARRADALDAVLAHELVDLGTHQTIVHQATGMVAVQVGADMADALVRLRARAFASDRPISAVAADIVARRARFDP